jgi:hypothetical protein
MHAAPCAAPRRPRSAAAALLALACAATAPAQADEPLDRIAELYARYASDGRSHAEIHLSTDGTGPATRTTPQPDGTVACRIAGLPAPGPGNAGRAGRRLLAALLVHEVTHCFTGPYLGPLLVGGDDAASRSADVLFGLTAEAASDAAAVIAVFRHDGVEAAAALVAAMRPARFWAPSRAHETVPALNGALALVRTTPQAVATPQGAFDAATEIGRDVARRAVRDAPEAALEAQQAALVLARAAFANGRYANDAFTWRVRDVQSAPGDLHVFLRDGGEARREPALGAEGAHAVERLRRQLAADDSDEQRLAVRWLRRVGDLQPHSLAHTRAIVARFLGSVAGNDAARRTQLLELLGRTIDGCCPGADIAAVLDATVDRWRER